MLEERLKPHLKRNIEVVVNKNRSTMLSMQGRTLSVHKMFEEAPDHVIEAIAGYARGVRKERSDHTKVLRRYINDHLSEYAQPIEETKCVTRGKIYDLDLIYQTLNKRYFADALDVALTWFGQTEKKPKRQITLGQFVQGQNVIKIHRVLDQPQVPYYFIAFVLYHEMVHVAVPSYVDQSGRLRMHGPEFRKKEREFKHYEKALNWEEKHKKAFFTDGRT